MKLQNCDFVRTNAMSRNKLAPLEHPVYAVQALPVYPNPAVILNYHTQISVSIICVAV
jgi:hypothetical protein